MRSNTPRSRTPNTLSSPTSVRGVPSTIIIRNRNREPVPAAQVLQVLPVNSHLPTFKDQVGEYPSGIHANNAAVNISYAENNNQTIVPFVNAIPIPDDVNRPDDGYVISANAKALTTPIPSQAIDTPLSTLPNLVGLTSSQVAECIRLHDNNQTRTEL